MAEFTPADMPLVLQACRENLSGVNQAYDQCFLTKTVHAAGDLQVWSAEGVPGELSGPGLLLDFQIGGVHLHAAIPESLPLPAWCRSPGKSEAARLQTLPVEWSITLLPPEWVCDSSVAQFVEDLGGGLAESQPLEGAQYFKISVGEDPAGPGIYVLGPSLGTCVTAAVDEPVAAAAVESVPPPSVPARPPLSDEAARRLAQVMNMPVPIIVVMAEKKISLGKLLTMGPGTIISFEKSCDDLLDLCVNNRAICSGEAVKIGEKFGLKINEHQSTADRLKALQRSRVL